jgi:hypothetical protein
MVSFMYNQTGKRFLLRVRNKTTEKISFFPSAIPVEVKKLASNEKGVEITK